MLRYTRCFFVLQKLQHTEQSSVYAFMSAQTVVACEPADVLEAFGVTAKDKSIKNTLVQISFDEKRIIDIIGRDEVHIDDILEQTNMPIPRLATLLTSMEIKGFLQKLSGNVYCCKIKIDSF